MPKLKSHSGAKKRFSRTGKGKIKHKRAYSRHILAKKSSKRIRKLRKIEMIKSKKEVATIKKLIP